VRGEVEVAEDGQTFTAPWGDKKERKADKVPSVGTGSALAQAMHEQSLLLVALFGFLAVGAAWASRRLLSTRRDSSLILRRISHGD
jgi:hypothetical protein